MYYVVGAAAAAAAAVAVVVRRFVCLLCFSSTSKCGSVSDVPCCVSVTMQLWRMESVQNEIFE